MISKIDGPQHYDSAFPFSIIRRRTSLAVELDTLTTRFGATTAPGVGFPNRYNLASSEDLPANQNDGPAEIEMLKCGIIPNWADDPRRPEPNQYPVGDGKQDPKVP